MAAIPQTFGVGNATALTDGATITIDMAALGNFATLGTTTGGGNAANAFKVTLGGNRTLNVANAADGQIIHLFVTQDGTGSRTLTVTLNGQAASVLTSGTPLTTTAGALDLVALQIRLDTGKILYYPIAKAFA